MPADDLRARMEALNRQPLANVPPAPAPDDAFAAEGAAPLVTGDDPAQGGNAMPLPSAALEVALPGVIVEAPDGGAYYCIERRLTDHAPWADSLGHRVRAAFAADALCTKLRHPSGVPADHVLFLDIETLGLNTEPIFLVGTLVTSATGDLLCRQLLARTLAEEAAILSALADALRHARALVTFNGIDFDMRLVGWRARRHGIDVREPRAHLDVLVEARKRFRTRLPNCRLQTLEERLCGRTRVGDVPGAQIPGIYEEFTRTGDAALLAVVLQHNLLDLATTAELVARFWGGA